MSTPAASLTVILRRALTALPEPPAAEIIAGAEVTAAADTRFGDYQSNVAMALAKQRRTNPRALATELREKLNADPELAGISAPVEIAGAGFLNFRLKAEFLAARLGELLADDARVGVEKTASPQTIVIDFSSPNIAKPMHVGHLRSTILGDCFARIARFLGHTVISDNHLGDWGTQFGIVIYGWKHFRDDAALVRNPLAELVRIYQHVNELIASAMLDETAPGQYPVSQKCREELAKLQAGDAENLAIWQQCVDVSRAELDKIYARLGVHFDVFLGESFYNAELAPLVERLVQKGIAEPSEGAIVIFFRDNPRLLDKPSIIRKRDGAFNYTTTDIATLEHRTGALGGTAMWNVVGAPQALHFEQLNAIGRKMGIPVPATHIAFGSILGEDRKLMRTRSGDNIALRDLLDEADERARAVILQKQKEALERAAAEGRAVPEQFSDIEIADIAAAIGIGAVKYAELSQHRLTDYVFSWDKMLAFHGNTAPYLQNAYVRIQSIFRRQAASGEVESSMRSATALALTEPAELALAKKLAQFAETVPAVLDDFRPNLLATYLFELANEFHAFYEACPVLKSEGVTRATRLALCRVTANALKTGLDLLGIGVPARM